MKRLTNRTIDMLRKMIFALMLSICVMSFYAQLLKAGESAKSVDEIPAVKTAEKGMVSLAEDDTETCYELRRYPKFY